MESTRVRLFTTTGQRLSDVTLPLSKTEACVRLLRRIAKSGEGSGLTGRLADLDAGRLEFSLLRKLFSKAEIVAAVHTRLGDASLSETERSQLTRILQDRSLWTPTQGGEAAMRADRFGIGRYDSGRESHHDTFGGHASRGDNGDPEGKARIRKSREQAELSQSVAFEGATTEAKAHGWRVSRSTPGGGLALHHQKHSGHELTIDTSADWQHEKRGGEKVASGGHGELRQHLSAFHGTKD